MEMSRDDHDCFDYLAFYDRFRSPPEQLKKHQSRFMEYFSGCHNVVDIGCGRGEFLELLRDSGIGGIGVDTDGEMIRLCRSKGLEAEEIDGVAFLEREPIGRVDGIFMDQVIEHMDPRYMLRLLCLCYDKLAGEGVIVVKTINPLSLSTFTDFFLDPTHIRPVHPEALKYIVESLGFTEIETRFVARVPDRERLNRFELAPGLGDRERRMAETYNRNIEILNGLLFGAEDYAVIARKRA